MSCAHCSAYVEPGDLFCTSCGHPVQAPHPPAEVGRTAVGQGRSCQQCGEQLGDEDQFCTSCGTIFQPAAQATVVAPAPAPAPATPHMQVPVATPDLTASASPHQPTVAALGSHDAGVATAAPTRRRKRLVTVAAVLLLVLGAAGVAGWYFTTTSRPGTEATSPFDVVDEPTTSTAEPTTTTTEATTTSPPTTAATTTSTANTVPQPILVPGAVCSGGDDGFLGQITGVEETATMRSGVGIDSAELAQIGLGQDIVYFPDSAAEGPRFSWMEVSFDDECGWMASKFVKGADGLVVGPVTAVDYVHRSLRGLEPDALHATLIVDDPSSGDYVLVPFDDTFLAPFVQEMRALYLSQPTLEAVADASVDSGATGEDGCEFGDFQYCTINVESASGQVIGTVFLSYVGNGVTDAQFTPA